MSEGLITAQEFEGAIERVGTREGRIGDVLVENGLVTREDFLAALRRYTIGLVREVQTWTGGDFRFFVGEDVVSEEGFEPIRMKEVLPPGTALDRMRSSALAAREAASEAAAESPGDEDAPGERAALREVPVGSDEAAGEAFGESDAAAGEDDSPGGRGAWLRGVGRVAGDLPGVVAHVAPLVVLVALAVVVVWRPNSLVYPFFWLETERLQLEKQRRTSVYLKIDRAAKTFFLLEGRFPDDLYSLVARGLLAPGDVVGVGGRVLGYVPGDRGYVIRPAAADGTDSGVSKNEAIAGNFFLDPEFVVQLPDRGPPPLVLLD